ncbi:MAG UNVERIFIED_CONTAM: hypothetical protein LVR18_13385 [Planctomycetaceae bacterium]
MGLRHLDSAAGEPATAAGGCTQGVLFEHGGDAMITDIDNLLKDALREAIVEINSLKQQLNQGQLLFAQVRAQLAELQSQPRLQRVTPEAMAAIKQRDFSRVLFVMPFTDADGKQLVSHNVLHWYYNQQAWYEEDDYPAEDTESSHDWFIDLSTIPEVTQ